MAEMQQPATPATPAAPATPQAPPATAGIDLSGYSANQLRRMLDELRRQRQDLADRRGSLGDSYERSTGDNKLSMLPRLNTLDNNIARLEVDIDRVGRAYAAKAGGEAATTQPPSRPPGNFIPEGE